MQEYLNISSLLSDEEEASGRKHSAGKRIILQNEEESIRENLDSLEESFQKNVKIQNSQIQYGIGNDRY